MLFLYMLFHTPSFILFSLTTILAVRFLKGYEPWVFFFTSLIWYSSFGWLGTIVLVFSATTSWYCLVQSRKYPEYASLCTTVALSILAGIFFFFRGIHPELAPLGLSFFIFQKASLVVDLRRQPKLEIPSWRDAVAFLGYFPLLVAGPVVRMHQLLPGIKKPFRPTTEQYISGFLIFTWGFFKKAVIADMLDGWIKVANFNATSKGPILLASGFLTTAMIYADFSGYCDMARGVSRCCGIELPINFRPFFFATSPMDFWRRWNITVGTWFRDYVVVPLAGRRASALRKDFAIFMAFLLIGIWHSIGWGWFVFGTFHGLNAIFERRLKKKSWFPLLSKLWMPLFFTASGLLHLNATVPSFTFRPITEGWDQLFYLPVLLRHLAWPLSVLVFVDFFVEYKNDQWEGLLGTTGMLAHATLFLALGIWFQPSMLNMFVYFNF